MRIVIIYVKYSFKDSLSLTRIVKCESNSDTILSCSTNVKEYANGKYLNSWVMTKIYTCSPKNLHRLKLQEILTDLAS